MRSIYEKRAHKELEEEGYFVDFKIRPFMVPKNYQVDYWGLFDLAAYKPGEIRLVSVKGTSVPNSHRKALRGFVAPQGVSVELWWYRKLKSRDQRRKYRKIERF